MEILAGPHIFKILRLVLELGVGEGKSYSSWDS